MTCVTGARRNSLLFLPWRSEEGGFFFCLKQQSRWEVDTSGSARLSCNACSLVEFQPLAFATSHSKGWVLQRTTALDQQQFYSRAISATRFYCYFTAVRAIKLRRSLMWVS